MITQKTLGIIGGVSWHSTLEYYRLINEGVQEHLGGIHSAKIIINNLDMAEISIHQHSGNWTKIAEILIEARASLERAGARHFLIGANTLHKVSAEVTKDSSIPFLSILDATAAAILRKKFKTALLMGTSFTMQDGFYVSALEQKGIHATTPSIPNQKMIHRIIFEEILLGRRDASQGTRLADIISEHSVDCVIMGCTEIPLVLSDKNTKVPLIDTLSAHVDLAVKQILS